MTLLVEEEVTQVASISKESRKEDLKSAMVTLLRSKQQIGMDCDLSCYQTQDGYFQVDYILCEETVHLLHLDEEQERTLVDEEELIEIFETAEEAADFYLKLTGGRMIVCSDEKHGHGHHPTKKRTFKQKALSYDKDRYF